jgi:hypothetical protein
MKNIKLFAVTFLLLLACTTPKSTENTPTSGFAFTKTSLDHGSISLSDYEGRVVYLFFFGYN